MTGVIPEYPLKQFLDSSGNPIANGRVYTWQANAIGVTPLSTWTDKGQVAANANPIVLDSEGKANIWLAPLQVYDFVVKDSTSTITYYTIEDISGVPASVTVDEWQGTGLTPSFISASSFTVPGNQTSNLKVGSRLRLTDTTLKYATVISSVFSSLTTIIVSMDSGVITTSISAVDVGNLSPDNASGLYASGNLINLTGYTGSDIQLKPGQTASYSASAIATLALRIATGDNQEYTLSWRGSNAAAAVNAAQITLKPNNVVTPTSVCSNFIKAQFNTTDNNTVTVSQNILPLNIGGTPYQADLKVCTKTIAKAVKGQVLDANVANGILHGVITSVWNDTTTVWASLGTLTFAAGFTGLIIVKREL